MMIKTLKPISISLNKQNTSLPPLNFQYNPPQTQTNTNTKNQTSTKKDYQNF